MRSINFLLILFVSFNTLANETLTFKLGSEAITATAVKKTSSFFDELYYEEDKYVLEVRLGPLTEPQFKAMKTAYPHSSIAYKEGQAYHLIDFMPPVIQALNGKTFEPIDYISSVLDFPEGTFDEEDAWTFRNGLSTFANCWNTSIEFLRQKAVNFAPESLDYLIYWPGRYEANEVLRDPQWSEEVLEKDIQPGDVLLVLVDGGPDGPIMNSTIDGLSLAHTAIVISKDLLYEKTDSSVSDAYRLSLKKDVIKKYVALLTDDEAKAKPVFMYRRFSKKGLDHLVTEVPTEEEGSDKTMKVLETLFPGINQFRMAAGCEDGMGGGCSITATIVREIKIDVNSKTGRGEIRATSDLLPRFREI